MASIEDLVKDADLLVGYATAHNIALPDGCAPTLLAAKGQASALSVPGDSRTQFYAAFAAAAAACKISVADIHASRERQERLRPLVGDAHSLLTYATINAKQVDDEIRNPLVVAADAVQQGNPSVGDEQNFLKAYQALSAKTAPVTADTLQASKTKLPEIDEFFAKGGWVKAWKGLTIGRFFSALLFAAMLVMTGVSLGYYTVGSTGLARYRELHASIDKLEAGLLEKKDVLAAREIEVKAKAGDDRAAAQAKFNESDRSVKLESASLDQAKVELKTIPDRLWRWSQQPCGPKASPFFSWTLCSVIDQLPAGASAPVDLAKLQAADTVADKLRDVYLPLLLGWLGAHAFILRQMVKEIGDQSFTKSSALRHIVRLGLGALAGFAAVSLLTPQAFSGDALKNIPAWGLAFIAGYGIELVFSFMDRIIGAFTTKPT